MSAEGRAPTTAVNDGNGGMLVTGRRGGGAAWGVSLRGLKFCNGGVLAAADESHR